RVGEYVGGYDDWLLQRKIEPRIKEEKASAGKGKPKPRREQNQKLSYKDQRELEGLPQQIEMLETEQEMLYQTLSDPSFYRENGSEIAAARTRLELIEHKLEEAYARWEVLEAKSEQGTVGTLEGAFPFWLLNSVVINCASSTPESLKQRCFLHRRR
ncbi:MAG: hypothetical protein WCA08_00785, partial [Desulfoferrobacter sp.]